MGYANVSAFARAGGYEGPGCSTTVLVFHCLCIFTVSVPGSLFESHVSIWCFFLGNAMGLCLFIGFPLGSNMLANCSNTTVYVGVTISQLFQFRFAGRRRGTVFLSATGVGHLFVVASSTFLYSARLRSLVSPSLPCASCWRVDRLMPPGSCQPLESDLSSQSLAHCKSSSYVSCCDFGVHGDCSQGCTASDQCEEASYAVVCFSSRLQWTSRFHVEAQLEFRTLLFVPPSSSRCFV